MNKIKEENMKSDQPMLTCNDWLVSRRIKTHLSVNTTDNRYMKYFHTIRITKTKNQSLLKSKFYSNKLIKLIFIIRLLVLTKNN